MASTNAEKVEYRRCVIHGRWMLPHDKDCHYNQPFKTEGCMTASEYEASLNDSPTR